MSDAVKLSNYTDFDRMLSKNNLIVTLIGAVLAFITSYLPATFIPLPISPFALSISFAVMIATITFTRNLASTVIVAIAGAIGLISSNGDPLYFIIGYIQFSIIFCLLIGMVADQLKLILSWTRLYLIFGFIFSLIFVVMSLQTNPAASRYWGAGVPLGTGGDQYLDTTYPLIEIASIFILLIVFITSVILLKGHISLEESSAKIYKIMGLIFVVAAFVLGFVSLFLYTQVLDYADIQIIADTPTHVRVLDNLFSHQSIGEYAVFVAPVNGFLVVAFSTMLFAIGSSFLLVGMKQGNLEGVHGGIYTILFTPALATLIFFGISSWYIQSLISATAFYIALELFPVYLAMIWSYFMFNALIALIFHGLFVLIFRRE